MDSSAVRRQALADALASRILVLDGAMGTMIQRLHLTEDDYFGNSVYADCPETLVLSRPDLIGDIHAQYYGAGADIVETNSFGGTPFVLNEFELGHRAHEINVAAARVARGAAARFDAPGRLRFVAGSMGPTTRAISLTGGISFPDLRQNFYVQAKGLLEGGADILLIETSQDTRNVKAALLAIDQLGAELGYRIPTMVSGTIEPMGTMLAGQTADAFYASIAHVDLLSVGLNCATGPDLMTDHMRTLHEISSHRISCYPNAGLPNPDTGKYEETPESLAAQLEKFVDHGWINIVGGCCGTTPEHIAAIASMTRSKQPRPFRAPAHRTYFSGIETVEADDTNRPLIVGERTNVIGSRKFKDLIAAEQWEEAAAIAKAQVRKGAHIIDVCLQSSDRDELKDIPRFYEQLIKSVIKAPIMVDTTDPEAIELSLTYTQGKSIINSVNLEDGEEKFEKVCPLARRYGAALVVGTIDEDKLQAQAFTRQRKLEVAQRSTELLTTKYGIPPEDILIDPLVFPCATGDENYIGGAVETIEALRLIKSHIPYVKTVLGISNISFGLPAAAREVVNSVFLYHCTKAGLDLAIVNAEKLERFASIPDLERNLAESLLFSTPPLDIPADQPQAELLRTAPLDWREQTREQKMAVNQFHIAAITDYFRKTVKKSAADASHLPLDERLARYIIQGTKEGLLADLDAKRAEGAAPLDIINGPLMAGMAEVGRLFNNNELIVAEVLQSAEAMKAAVSHLQQFMEKADTASRGKILLATVKGDVHDIGKNLVEIILANNGYDVVNLGIKVPSDQIVKAYYDHTPHAIGLSGLLVKSAQQMIATAADLKDAGIHVPLLVGGAALSDKFTRTRIAPSYGAPTLYAKDAMTGLRLMNQLMDPAEAAKLAATAVLDEPAEETSQTAPISLAQGTARSSKVRVDVAIPLVPYTTRQVRNLPQLQEIWGYINPYMLYGRHLGYKGNFEKKLAEREDKALELFHNVEELKLEVMQWMKIGAVWQFFETERDGNSLHLFAPGAASPLHTFHFGRQAREGDGLCLSDFVLDPQNGHRDHLAMFVVSAGHAVREHAEEAKRSGQFFRAHALQALAIESAEATAEWLHRRIREDWGFADPATMTMQERFTSRYRGKRYSFGYGACPNLDDQQAIWSLINPDEIGVQLTDGMMMEPEASVSALVFHHPDCVYFSVADTAEAA